jgi:hypothetical protein
VEFGFSSALSFGVEFIPMSYQSFAFRRSAAWR